ncbi:FUSC family protein [Roseomonas terrae]|uniref:FUSC family protein n=1 Tax=Neoroseomonas terrae TaxID=424799 RepID=A0ABS5EPU0_9PROT|nr:FUSC family protein [Neoroseomonas terrae]MBR0653040.1 FUSC family protein [Neoroseomonas terrae]
MTGWQQSLPRSGAPSWRALAGAFHAGAPPLLFGLRLAASVCLALYLAFWLELDAPGWAGTSAAMVCQPQLGASLRKGWFRMLGTIVGAVVAVAITAAFPQDRTGFLILLALWGGACALAATLLRNFAAYAAGLAALTTAVIVSDQLGATGGPNGDAFMLAVTRMTEVCLGIASAGVILAATDLGAARRGLATTVAGLIADIGGGFAEALGRAGADLPDSRPVRREFMRRVIALDPAIDQAIGESAALRNRSLTLQAMLAGGVTALGGWRAAALRLVGQAEAAPILAAFPPALRTAFASPGQQPRLHDPARLDAEARAAARALADYPARSPSERLLADQTAKTLGGLADMLNGLALLEGARGRAPLGRGAWRFQVPDWHPALVNAGRAILTILAAQLLWIVTAWPQGAVAIIWAAVPAILFAPRADQAFAGAVDYMLGNVVAVTGAAVVGFMLLPALSSFPAFGLALAVYLVPVGAVLASGWRPSVAMGMVASFVPFLSPTNAMAYNIAGFLNNAVALFVGCGIAMLAFRLWPPPPVAHQAARLLGLSLRDLRALAAAPQRWTASAWTARLYARIAALPDQAAPLGRARLLVAHDLGEQILRLHGEILDAGRCASLGTALAAIAGGRSAAAVACLAELDRALVADGPAALQARAAILAISEALTDHAAYIDDGAVS